MDLLKKEMEKKKKALQLAKQQKEKENSSRFLRAAELRRIEEEQQEEEERQREKKRKLKETLKREKKNREPAEKKSRTEKQEEPTVETIPTQEKLSPSEVTRRFRELGLPVRLFGERTIKSKESEYDDSQRLQRLAQAMEQQRHAMAGMSEMDEFRLGSGHGIRNPFLGGRKEQDESHTQESASTVLQQNAAASGSAAKSATAKEDGAADAKEQNDGDADDPHKRIHRFFKGLLRQWEDDLALRPESVKRTAAGKNETKTLKQCKDYIRPLFKLCKKRTLEPSLMAHIIKIVDCCEEGEFVKAHDAYMDLAIGRAAWPIGVTMVGIHARSGRAKIESSNVAHVMNSELQRKYLTSVKRLMSYYQKKRDDVAPSKKVMN